MIFQARELSYGCGYNTEEVIALEQEELTRLFRACADDVFRLAYSFLNSRSDAEDICQTVFLRLAEGRSLSARPTCAATI